jgi:hypothetical protein
MKVIFSILLLLLCVHFYFSQELTDEEYEIYGTFIGEQEYDLQYVKFEVPAEYKSLLVIDDPIAVAIHDSPMKSINNQKLFTISSKHKSLDQKYIIKNKILRNLYLSPIVFKGGKGYFFAVSKMDNPLIKPNYMFLLAIKKKDWIISDYYDIF